MDLELIRDFLFYIEECKTGLFSDYDSHFIEKLKNNNYTIEFDVKCDEIQNIYFDFNNKFVDFTENYKKIVRNCITYK